MAEPLNTAVVRVGLVGAGLSGLALANRLRCVGGVDVTVFERDESLESRSQGFRITLDSEGLAALRASLSPDMLEVALRSSGPPGGHFRFTNERVRDAFVLSFDTDSDSERQVDREVLRRILLNDLGHRVKFGHSVTSLRDRQSGVAVLLADGREEIVDLAVVADGIGSRLQHEVFAGATPTDTGRGGIYGRLPLVLDGHCVLPPGLLDSGVLAMLNEPGSAFFFTAMRFQESPADVFAAYGLQVPAPNIDDYVMWGLVLTPTTLDRMRRTSGSSALQDEACRAVSGAHPLLQGMVARTDPTTLLLRSFAAGVEPAPASVKRAGSIAVMGDAIHPMPPFGAHGGNTALRDAHHLGDFLAAAVQNGQPPAQAVAEYHNLMCGYGFDAVQTAMNQMSRLSTTSPVQRWALRRLLPALHRRTVPDHPWPEVPGRSAT